MKQIDESDLRSVLEKLETAYCNDPDCHDGYYKEAITICEQALAEQPAQQQDIDWKDQYEKQKRRAEMWIAKYEADIGPLKKAGPVKAQQQEPVAFMDIDENGTFSGLRYWSEPDNRHEVALYKSPSASKSWVELTENTILNLMPESIPADYDSGLLEFADAVIAACKEKNT